MSSVTLSLRSRWPFPGPMLSHREIAAKRELAPSKRKLNLSSRVIDALAGSTRRAILERLSGSGELTVNGLIEHLGITEQAVAKHLGILERAGLVICRRNGGRRANYYRTRPSGAAPLLNWLVQQQIVRIDQLTTSASRELDNNVSSDPLERASN
jgi:DNA-binding transcriptional ArsR family regulator